MANGAAIPRPEPKDEAPSEDVSEWGRRVDALRARLLQGLPEDPNTREPGDHGRQLLADVVDWHRRDAKPGWREVFRIRGLTEQELVDASIPIGGLGAEGSKGRIQQKGTSDRYEYPFPAQEYGIKLDDDVECPVTGQRLGTVIEIDRGANVVAVKRTTRSSNPHEPWPGRTTTPMHGSSKPPWRSSARPWRPHSAYPATKGGSAAQRCPTGRPRTCCFEEPPAWSPASPSSWKANRQATP
jgi:hypothetical protein